MRWLSGRKRAAPKATKTGGPGGPPEGNGPAETQPAQKADLHRPIYPRQLSPGNMLTISEENGILRAVAFRGWRVLAWGTAIPEPAGNQDQASAPAEVAQADRLRALLRALAVRPDGVVADLPFLAPLLRRLALPKVDRHYVAQVAHSELMQTLPFAAEGVDVAWRARPKGTGYEVFATAVPKAAVDQRFQMLKGAKLRPLGVYSKAQALALASGVTEGIVVHLSPSQATAVLLLERVPRIVHQVRLVEGDQPAEQARTVAKAVEVVAEQYQILEPVSEGTALPVVLTGQLAAEAPLAEALGQILHREVLPFAPPLTHPEQFSPAEYAINLGLALSHRMGTRARRRAPATEVPPVNLLSERHLPRPVPTRLLATLIILLFLSVGAGLATDRLDATTSRAAQLSARLETVSAQERQHRLTLNQVKGLQEKTRAVEQLVQGLEANLTGLKGDMEALLERLGMITSQALPPGARLSNVSLRGDGFALSGTASSYEEVLQFTANLRASKLFYQVKIAQAGGTMALSPGSEGGEGEVGRIVFQVKASLPPAPQPEPTPGPK